MADVDVSAPCAAYLDMAPHWELPTTLMGGTLAMRAAKKKYLPPYPLEERKEYEARLGSTVLFNAYARTVRSLSGMPFRESVKVEQLLPALDDMIEDADTTGRSLTNFAHDLLSDMLHYGKAHFTVAMPNVRQERERVGGRLTLLDEQRLGVRPYFAQVSPLDLIGWRGARLNGQDRLQTVRIRERVIMPQGAFGEKCVNRVRVYEEANVTVWEQDPATAKWFIADAYANELQQIALVTVYGNRTGFLTGLPALEDLAFLNLRHWQSHSDQDNILHFARTYFLAFLGWDAEDIKTVAVGTSRGIANRDVGAKVQVVEHSGAAIGAGRQDLNDKKDEMRALGAEILTPRAGAQTATERIIEHTENISDLQAMVRNLEVGLEQGFRFAAAWINAELSPEFVVDISEEFTVTEDTRIALQELREDLKLGVIDRLTYLQERKRRGLYDESVDPEAVLAAAETESAISAVPDANAGAFLGDDEQDANDNEESMDDNEGATT